MERRVDEAFIFSKQNYRRKYTQIIHSKINTSFRTNNFTIHVFIYIGNHFSLGIFGIPWLNISQTHPIHSLNLVMCLMVVMFGLDVGWKDTAGMRILQDGFAEISNGAEIPPMTWIWCLSDFCIFFHGDLLWHNLNAGSPVDHAKTTVVSL